MWYCFAVSAFLPTAHVQEYQELVAQFKRQEQQLYQFCEEKVTLAHHAADLIQQHQKELESVSGSGVGPGCSGGRNTRGWGGGAAGAVVQVCTSTLCGGPDCEA
jgi:hypothetical protein